MGKLYLKAACTALLALLMGGVAEAYADEVASPTTFTFTDNNTWKDEMLTQNKTYNAAGKEVTASETTTPYVTLNFDAAVEADETAGTSATPAGAVFKLSKQTGLYFNKSTSKPKKNGTLATANYVEVYIPANYYASFSFNGISASRPFGYSTDGGAKFHYPTANFTYYNETDTAVTLRLWATNPIGKQNYSIQCLNSVTLNELSTLTKVSGTINVKNGSTVIKSFTTEEAYEGQTVSIYVPKYVESNGTYYSIASGVDGSYYKVSVAAGSSKDITCSVSNITYYDEFEKLKPSHNWAASGNVPERAAGGDWKRLSKGSYVVLTSTPGTYNLTIAGRNAAKSAAKVSIGILKDNVVTANDSTKEWASGANKEETWTDVVVGEDESLVLVNTDNDNNSNLGADYFTLTRTDAVVKTFPEFGYATFSNDKAVSVPEGVTVYTGRATSEGVTITPVEGATIIPANTGVMLKGTGTVTFSVTTEEGSSIADNEFVATSQTPTVTEAGYYGLSASGLEFLSIASNTTFTAHKAYIKGVASSSAKSLKIIVQDTVTGINGVEGMNGKANDAIYNLAGQRVGNNYKGVVIKNGKKYIQ